MNWLRPIDVRTSEKKYFICGDALSEILSLFPIERELLATGCSFSAHLFLSNLEN
jgi:hypothetical protein